MGTDIHAWIDYYEPVVTLSGERSIIVDTLAALGLMRDYILFQQLSGVRNCIDEIIEVARRIDPVGMSLWATTGPGPFMPLGPKGLPERLGIGAVQASLGYGFAQPTHPAHGTPLDRECDNFRPGGIYIWPPDTNLDHHSFSWLTHPELAAVADCYAQVPKIVYPETTEGVRQVVGNATLGQKENIAEKVDYGRRNHELDAILGMMEGINRGDPNRSRFIFWFDN